MEPPCDPAGLLSVGSSKQDTDREVGHEGFPEILTDKSNTKGPGNLPTLTLTLAGIISRALFPQLNTFFFSEFQIAICPAKRTLLSIIPLSAERSLSLF